MANGQESYDRVADAATNLRAAMDAYLEARYANYRTRLVSPSGAYHHAVEDLADIVGHALDHSKTQLAYAHGKEIRGL